MPKDLKFYMELAAELEDRDSGLREMQAEMDRMTHLDYQLPEALQRLEWMRKVVTTAPYDAIYAAVRALAGLDERIRVDPVSVLKKMPDISPESDEARRRANEWEIALKWQFDSAARRRDNIRAKMIESALRYDEICAQVVHLPTQIKAIKKLGGNARRQEAARRYGDFAILVRNPQNVHTVWSDYMMESVLYVKVLPPQEIVDFWGDRAKKLRDMMEKGTAADSWVIYDYHDYESRVVWAVPGEVRNRIATEKENIIEIMREDWKYDFIPWANVVGATQLDADPEKQRRPLLYGIYRAEQWITTNIVKSLQASEAIAEMGRPDVKKIGPTPESIMEEFAQPGGAYEVPMGHDVMDMAQRGLDPALRELGDRLEAEIASATIPRILVTAEAAPGEPFSGYNLRVQQALASLVPYKMTGERGMEAVDRLMLLWAKNTGSPIKGYGKDGKQYQIEPEEIDPDSLYLSVELTPDVPLDRQQRIASAVQMSREMKYPTRKILEELGETNPEEAMREWAKEQIFYAELGGVVQLIQSEAAGVIQQLAAQMAQGMVQQMQEQSMGQAGMTGLPEQQPTPGSPMGIEGVEGQAFNPAEGGAPPAGAFPPGTFENQTGRTRAGLEAGGNFGL